jgi:hypothetical protein
MPIIGTTRLGTGHSCKVWMKLHQIDFEEYAIKSYKMGNAENRPN